MFQTCQLRAFALAISSVQKALWLDLYMALLLVNQVSAPPAEKGLPSPY